MKLSLLKRIHHFSEFFKLRTSLWWKILPLTGLWEKHTNPALSSKTCWSHAILLLPNAGHVLIAPYTPKCNGHGSHRILHCYHERLQLFREFLRLCIQNRCSPSHSQMISRSSMISLFPLPTFPTWHQDHHEAAAHLWLLCKLHWRCLAFVRRFATPRLDEWVPFPTLSPQCGKETVCQRQCFKNLMMFEQTWWCSSMFSKWSPWKHMEKLLNTPLKTKMDTQNDGLNNSLFPFHIWYVKFPGCK